MEEKLADTMEEEYEKMVQKAKRERLCPFCNGEFFSCPISATQGLWFNEDGKPEWGDIDYLCETLEDEGIFCASCGKQIPLELSKVWFA